MRVIFDHTFRSVPDIRFIESDRVCISVMTRHLRYHRRKGERRKEEGGRRKGEKELP